MFGSESDRMKLWDAVAWSQRNHDMPPSMSILRVKSAS